ncbi:hypothetical protein BMR1_03g00820 [Babesia microti strain RI]|uniref:Reticulon domain-containing protein n=1 Tax=Babesia microti (strain RI) TaxID=1133968 RepID=A0A0K3AQ49_BABMR|nr:hypothetical protein BMR1_03g00820 [Babesia microti strain RI]CTQ40763.1 hypothetical protein BMR1_03g00820 [Babesia microti strain RI]|eukprot:XP_012648774.1 hypothetical protein BMR1_03g00820 [Babesia microti strain RI]
MDDLPGSLHQSTPNEKPMAPPTAPKSAPHVPISVESKELSKEIPKESPMTKEDKKDVAKSKVSAAVTEKKVVKEPVVPKITIEMKKFSMSRESTQYSIFIIFNLIFALLYIFKVRLMAIFCNLIIVAISIGAILSSIDPNRRKVDETNVNIIFISPTTVSDLAIVITAKLNQYISYFRRILLWQDFILSTRFTLCVYIMGILFKIIPLVALIYIMCWAFYLYMFICKEMADQLLDIIMVYLKRVSGNFDEFCCNIPKMKDVGKEL